MSELNTSSSSSSSSSSLSDYLMKNPKLRKVRQLQERIHMDYYDDFEFKMKHRFSKETVIFLVNLLYDQLVYEDNRGNPLSPTQQIMLTLRYYATGTFQSVTGDVFGVHQTTVDTIVHKVSREIAGLRSQYIKMPVGDEMVSNLNQFYQNKRIPKVNGLIDGTHIPIVSPDQAELFRNRKGFFSLNVQGICDWKRKFTNIVTRWHGSIHDMTIFNFSSVKQEFLDGKYSDTVLLGDGGYACSNTIITPYRKPDTPEKQKFNKAHSQTRVLIENVFGRWKKHFPILSNKTYIDKEKVQVIIVSTAVLHNLAIEQNDMFEFDDEHIQLNTHINEEYEGLESTHLRDAIAANLR